MKVKAILFGLCFASSLQAATITPKDGVEILFINGVEVEEQRDKQQIDADKTQLLIKYNKKLGSGNSAQVFDSAPFVLTLTLPETDAVIHPPKVYSYEAANTAFKRTPKWTVTSSKGQSISYQQEKLPPSSGLMPYWKTDELLADYNAKKGIAFGATAALMAKATTVESVAATASAEQASATPKMKKAEPVTEISNVEQLQAWYTKASKQERKAFRRWMIDQE